MSKIRLLVRPTLFTVGVCGTSFCVTAIVQHENNKFRQQQTAFGLFGSMRHQTKFDDWHNSGHRLKETTLLDKVIEIRRKVNTWANQLTPGEKIAFGTIFVNLLVLIAWRVRPFESVMARHFISQVSTKKIALSPLILSCFSHISALHFAINMYALHSFSNFATSLLGPEQLIGLYISAGTVSSLASLSFRLFTNRIVPSLGASGALLGVISYICVTQPDSRLLLFFIPIAAGNAIKGMMIMDTVGLLARWSYLDHAAHLSGALFGAWYATYGEKLFFEHRRKIVEQWLKLKSQQV